MGKIEKRTTSANTKLHPGRCHKGDLLERLTRKSKADFTIKEAIFLLKTISANNFLLNPLVTLQGGKPRALRLSHPGHKLSASIRIALT